MMSRYETLEVGKSIALAVEDLRLPPSLLELFRTSEPICAREGQCWDFKHQNVADDQLSLAELCKDVAAFFNAYGGFVVLGVEEVEKDLRFRASGLGTTSFPMQRFKGLLAKYLSVVPEIAYHEYELDLPSGNIKIASIAVPKRPSSITPAKFLVNGPEKKGKPIFRVDQVVVRRRDECRTVLALEDWQLVSSERKLDDLGLELGSFSFNKNSLSVSHNLPTRSAICRKFVGRKDYLSALWEWLNDEFQYCRVIAGDGGKGKTSLAYEFATQVARVAPCGFTRIVWLTAKKKQFHPESNEWLEMHETHFQDFRSLLEVVAENLGYLPAELSDLTDSQLNRAVRQVIDIQPTLFVFDDLDSLVPDDQKRTLEFASQVGKPDVRFLLTTRSNASYSSDLCLKLRGLDRDDFDELVDVLSKRYTVEWPRSIRAKLHAETAGSPLLLDSMFRVVRRGTDPSRAIREWSGVAGEDARRAVLQKEIELLSPEARRVLLCIAMFGQCSLAEVLQVSNLPGTKLDDCLRELESLFLVEAPKLIESQPRYEMNSTAIALVLSQRQDLAFDHARIKSQVSLLRAPLGKGANKRREEIGSAISQAIALARSNSYREALDTVGVALKRHKDNPDLLLLRARLGINSGLIDLDSCRRDMRSSYNGGCRKPLLFDLWLAAEREARFGPGMIEVCDLAVSLAPDDRARWAERKAEGYVLNALAKAKAGDLIGAASELSVAADEVAFALRSGEGGESTEEHLELLHDRIVQYASQQHDAGYVIDTVKDMLRRGDVRHAVFEAALTSLKELCASSSIAKDGTRDWVAAQCAYFSANLRAMGADAVVIAEKFDGLMERLPELA